MNTGYRQYLRKWRVIVYHNSSGDGIDVSDLRVVFSVSKVLSGEADKSSVAICNVSAETAASIVTGDKVILEAGYVDGNYGMIFTGEVTQVIVNKDGETDSAITMTVTDGDSLYKKSFVCTTLGAGASQSDVVEQCISSAEGIAEGSISSTLGTLLLPRGKVMFGKSTEYLTRVANNNDCQFFVTDGTVNIVSADEYDSATALELTPATGLIETPEQTDDGVKAKILINPSLRLNTMVHIDSTYVQEKEAESKGGGGSGGGTSSATMRSIKGTDAKTLSVNGIYKVTKITINGDTRGDDWYCEFEGVEVAGKQVSGNTGNQTRIWR